jgi:hypothetical protein
MSAVIFFHALILNKNPHLWMDTNQFDLNSFLIVSACRKITVGCIGNIICIRYGFKGGHELIWERLFGQEGAYQ